MDKPLEKNRIKYYNESVYVMKNKILLILILFMCILSVACYYVISYRNSIAEAQKTNKEYEQYENIQMLGTELISLINKTMDLNTTNGIQKDEQGLFIENDENSIKIYVNFIYKDDFKMIEMEKIANAGTESFVKTYSTASFKCTELTRHETTNNVRALTFTETNE